MATKVLIVENDQLAGELALYLLNEAGFDAELVADSRLALAAVKEKRPAVVLLDILMPGVDGLTLCHQIKSDPALEDVRVVMLSGKSSTEDRQRAMRFGADAFIKKPYPSESLARQISQVLEKASPGIPAQPLAQAEPAEPGFSLEVSVWGCRSLAPAAAHAASKYGHETSCVSVKFAENLLIFDAGSGINALSQELAKGRGYKKMWIFLTHFHEDHVGSLGGFACAQKPDKTLYVSGANEPGKNLQDMVSEIFKRPSARGPLRAGLELYQLQEDTYEIMPRVNLMSFFTNHTPSTLGFKLETESRKIVYCPDSEILGQEAGALEDYDEKLASICQDADLLIHDARYTPQDYRTRKRMGHSSFDKVVEFAAAARVKALLLFHHHGLYGDDTLDQIGKDAHRLISEKSLELDCQMAREGLTLTV